MVLNEETQVDTVSAVLVATLAKVTCKCMQVARGGQWNVMKS